MDASEEIRNHLARDYHNTLVHDSRRAWNWVLPLPKSSTSGEQASLVQFGNGSTNPAVIWQQISDINLHQHTQYVGADSSFWFLQMGTTQMDFQYFHKKVCLILKSW